MKLYTGLGNPIFDFGNLGLNFGSIPTWTGTQETIIEGAKDSNNYFQSAEYNAGIAAQVNSTSFGDKRTFDEIYKEELQKNIAKGLFTVEQQDLNRSKSEVVKNLETKNNTSLTDIVNKVNQNPDEETTWVKGLENWQTVGIGIFGIGILGTIIIVATNPKKDKKKKKSK